MAVQVRRGNEADFDASKMLPGEFGIALDSKKAFICFSAGDTKQMSTYEDMSNDIEAVTEDIIAETTAAINQAISDANTAADLANAAKTEAETATANALTAITATETATTNANTKADLAQSASDDANAAADEANDIALLLEAYTLRIYKPAVTNYSNIATTYPTPENGWTTTVTSEQVSYRYDGFTSQWVNIGYICTVEIANNTTAGIVKGGGNVVISLDGEMNVDLSAINESITKINNVRTATITTTWVGTTAPYTQDVTVTGITSDDSPFIDAVVSTQAQSDAWALVSRAVTGTNKITFTCLETKPTTAIPIQIKGA